MKGSQCVAVALCVLLGGCVAVQAPRSLTPGQAAADRPQTAPAEPRARPPDDPIPAGGDPVGITPEEQKKIPPLPPDGVQVDRSDGQVNVIWRGTRSDVERYEVYRRARDSPLWQLVGVVAGRPSDSGRYLWTDQSPVAGAVFGVAAYSPYGTSSAMVRA